MMKSFLLTSALIALAPVAASAATTVTTDSYSKSFVATLSAGEVVEYVFNASKDYVWSFAFAGTASRSALEGVSFSLGDGVWYSYDASSYKSFGPAYSANAALPSITASTVTVSYKYEPLVAGLTDPGVTLYVDAEAVPVPVPAAGLLMVAALGGVGVAAKRRKKA